MKLLLDLGNTRLKWALLDGAELGEMHADTLDAVDALPSAASALLASSCADAGKLRQLERLLAASGIGKVTRVGPPHSDTLLTLAYAEPNRLGADRWLAMRAICAASNASAERSFLVASVGTALTIDAVASSGTHVGGCIAPGLAAMRSALLSSAPHLRDAGGELQEFANSTVNAMYSGPMLAVAALIERQHDALARRVSGLPILYLTGGDAPTLLPLLRCKVQHTPDLVLRGLRTLGL